MSPKKNKPVESIITDSMATWTFIIIFLVACGVEIWFNHSSLIPSSYKFDPDTIILNLVLSLIAAVQGSIIMKDTRLADKKRDNLLSRIDSTTKRIEKLERKDQHDH